MENIEGPAYLDQAIACLGIEGPAYLDQAIVCLDIEGAKTTSFGFA
jgi:hypothetical protein